MEARDVWERYLETLQFTLPGDFYKRAFALLEARPQLAYVYVAELREFWGEPAVMSLARARAYFDPPELEIAGIYMANSPDRLRWASSLLEPPHNYYDGENYFAVLPERSGLVRAIASVNCRQAQGMSTSRYVSVSDGAKVRINETRLGFYGADNPFNKVFKLARNSI